MNQILLDDKKNKMDTIITKMNKGLELYGLKLHYFSISNIKKDPKTEEILDEQVVV